MSQIRLHCYVSQISLRIPLQFRDFQCNKVVALGCSRKGFRLGYPFLKIERKKQPPLDLIKFSAIHEYSFVLALVGYAQLAVRAKLAKRKLGNWAPNVQMAKPQLFFWQCRQTTRRTTSAAGFERSCQCIGQTKNTEWRNLNQFIYALFGLDISFFLFLFFLLCCCFALLLAVHSFW